jgi:glycosyltransferase involved in cell wall biosynthesis
MQPLVSVVIPCYNQAEFLARAVDSVLDQTYGRIEVVVVDDGSTDATPTVMAGYGSRIKAVRQANVGVSAARNAGLADATGEIVMFLDSDDFLFPDFIERHVAAMESHPEGAVFYGGCVQVDATDRELGRVLPKALPRDALVALLCANRIQFDAVTVRREAVLRIDGFDPVLSGYADWDWLIRLAAEGHRFVSVPGAWVAYRRHDESMSSSYNRMLADGLRVVAKHIALKRRGWRTRWALACGKRSVRYYAFQQALAPQLKRQLKNGLLVTALRRLLAALFQDGGSLRFFFLEYWMIRLVTLFHRTVEQEGTS